MKSGVVERRAVVYRIELTRDKAAGMEIVMYFFLWEEKSNSEGSSETLNPTALATNAKDTDNFVNSPRKATSPKDTGM